jgi:hypothetical protein
LEPGFQNLGEELAGSNSVVIGSSWVAADSSLPDVDLEAGTGSGRIVAADNSCDFG